MFFEKEREMTDCKHGLPESQCGTCAKGCMKSDRAFQRVEKARKADEKLMQEIREGSLRLRELIYSGRVK
jgi:hypothetical protein